ncbi:MAG: TIGR04282 family arsenosugar biosynthesis glycosyltransferase [Acidobacteriales bacterium]|nr:TIGR04282 family arsenosugar biosynthesis glycosyltransferase [Terriglobales bacterium]
MTRIEHVCVCIFAKHPKPGDVKTRLAATVGAELASDLAQAFLDDTWTALKEIPWLTPVIASTEVLPGQDHGEIWLQGEGPLGDRIEGILRRALLQSPAAFAIGADAPALPTRLLEQARKALGKADAVLGPSHDGGFYLLGLKTCPPGLLRDIPWSDPRTCEMTFARLRSLHFEVAMLDGWFDVDTYADLARLSESIAVGAIAAPKTEVILRNIKAASVPIGNLREDQDLPGSSKRIC